MAPSEPDPCGASCEPAEDAAPEARLRTVMHDPHGTHTFRDCGYSPQHAAHLLACDEHGCQTLANTDENKSNLRSQR